MMHEQQQNQAPPSPPLSFNTKAWIYMHFAAAATLFVLGVCYVPWIFSMFVIIGGVGTAIVAGLIGYAIGSSLFAGLQSVTISTIFALVGTSVGLFLLPATPVAVVTLAISGLIATLAGGFGLYSLSSFIANSLGFGREGYEPVPEDVEVSSIPDPDATLSNHSVLAALVQEARRQREARATVNNDAKLSSTNSKDGSDEENEEDEEMSEEISSDSDIDPKQRYGHGQFSQPTFTSQQTVFRLGSSTTNSSHTTTAAVELLEEDDSPGLKP